MNRYKGKKVIVTGGAGFIGKHLVQALLNEQAIVTTIDIPEADFSSLPSDVRIIKASIMEVEKFQDELNDADFLFHLAARTDLNGKNIGEYAINFEGTRRILVALQNNRHLDCFVLFSTQLVVGLFNETRFLDEREPYKTITLYGQSKILSEKITRELCQNYGMAYLIIRPTSVYGPLGKEPYRDFFLTIKNKRYFHVGKANNLISMCYVKNLVDQTLFLATRPEAHAQIFFGNDFHPYTMREFADAVAEYFDFIIPTIPDWIAWLVAYSLGFLKLFGIPVPLYPFRLRNIKANYCYDIGNSVRLGFFPTIDLKQGIEETLEWYTTKDQEFQ